MSNVLRALYYNTILKKSFYDIRIFENREQIGRRVFLNEGKEYYVDKKLKKAFLLPKNEDKPIRNGLRIYGFYDANNIVPYSIEKGNPFTEMMEVVDYAKLKTDYVDADTFNSILTDHFVKDIFHSEENPLEKYKWFILIGIGVIIIFVLFGNF